MQKYAKSTLIFRCFKLSNLPYVCFALLLWVEYLLVSEVNCFVTWDDNINQNKSQLDINMTYEKLRLTMGPDSMKAKTCCKHCSKKCGCQEAATDTYIAAQTHTHIQTGYPSLWKMCMSCRIHVRGRWKYHMLSWQKLRFSYTTTMGRSMSIM